MNYEVLLIPALYVAVALAVIVTLLRGVRRDVNLTLDDDGLKTVRWGYQSRSLRRAVYILGAAAIVIPSLVVTPPGHRGVIYSQMGGIDSNERAEGLSFVVPYFQTPHQVNVRTQKIEIEAFAQTRDLQEITVRASVNFRVDPTQAAELFQELGSGYVATVIAPAGLQRIDEEVGQILALSFASARGQLANDIEDALTEQLAGYGIVVEYVNIEDAIFDPDFINAVEAKVIATETVETELRLVDAAKNRADQVVRQAEGDAAAILEVATAQAAANDVIDASLTANVLLWQRILEWDGAFPTTFLAGERDALDILIGVPTGE